LVGVEYWGVRGQTSEIRLILGALNDYDAPSVGLSAQEARTLASELSDFAEHLDQ
jgi:hypothetical protein